MHYMLQHIAHDQVSWLWPSGDGLVRTNASERVKRRQLVEELLFWFYDGFLIPLIRVSILLSPDGLKA
jgi:telomerase reverse transcriptase